MRRRPRPSGRRASRLVRRHPARRVRIGFLARLRHHPVAYWALVGALAITTGSTVSSLARAAHGTVAAYGPLERVAVARHTIDAGEAIAASDVEWRELPAIGVPDRPATEVVDRVATTPIYPGEPIAAARLAPEGSSAVAARVPPGRQGVAIPLAANAPPLEVGDVVDLLAVIDPDPSGAPAERVARRAPVVDVGDEAATVAVDDAEARPLAFALSTGMIVVTLSGPD